MVGSEQKPMKPDDRYDSLIKFYAIPLGLDPKQIKKQIRAESNFNPGIVSKAGAVGLMQFMPETWMDFNPKDTRTDPEDSIAAGCLYMHRLLAKFGSLDKALAAYNWGPGNVQKLNGDSEWLSKVPTETRHYVRYCMSYIGESIA